MNELKYGPCTEAGLDTVLECCVQAGGVIACEFYNGPASCVVVLGRDAWPLVPVLRHIYSVPTQYFCWSRSSDSDSIGKQWLKEVPVGALVVDTGYYGSIPIEIKHNCDDSIYAIMLSSGSGSPVRGIFGNYVGVDHIPISLLESLPKPHCRVRTYEGDKPICESHPSDAGTVDADLASYIAWHYCRELGERLKKYVPTWEHGITIEERIGVTGDALNKHLASVAAGRLEYADAQRDVRNRFTIGDLAGIRNKWCNVLPALYSEILEPEIQRELNALDKDDPDDVKLHERLKGFEEHCVRLSKLYF